jgi:ATP-dependent DNA helicase PIF1
MEPFTLIALAAAAGFFFFKDDKPAHKKNGAYVRQHFPPKTYAKNNVSHRSPRLSTDTDLSTIEVLPEYALVKSLVDKGFPMVFVTGGAGTGKSTFIKWLVKEFDGSILLGAPTGMAAINIDGKTLHSLCMLPPAWILKKDIKEDQRRREIKEAKLLVIDEISMVTSNLLDGVSAFFRVNRGVDKPFGGLPVIMVGDMFQLPPVVRSDTRELFDRVYGSPKFYNAKSLREITYYGIELNKTFRQVDQVFVDLLTKIREGVDIPETLETLNLECQITNTPPAGSVWLSPRNKEVDQRNTTELLKIQSPVMQFRGTLEGKFKSDRLPSPIDLVLKVGAQVMFTKNDSQKLWINGTVGVVKALADEVITVEISNSESIVEVGQATWQDYQYKWDDETSEIIREETGRYTQFPLVLAWSITIHKSQGRTIERVHIDLGAGAFETGQTYVALSRCRAMSGLTLSRPLAESDIMVDHESKAFYDHLRSVIKKLPPEELMKTIAASCI